MEREWEGKQLNEAKKILAFEVTSLIHGEAEAAAAQTAAEALFESGGDLSTVPQITVKEADFGRSLLEILTESEVFPSKSEGRRTIKQGGLTLNDEKITDIERVLERSDLEGKDGMVRRGKKNYYRITVAE